MDSFLHGIKWTVFHGHSNYFQKPPLGGRPNKKPGDHGTPNAHDRWFVLYYHVWRPTWIKIHWNSIWLRASHIRLHTTLEHPWPHYMISEVCWDGGLLDTFFWALTISWSQLLARVWSGPKCSSPWRLGPSLDELGQATTNLTIGFKLARVPSPWFARASFGRSPGTGWGAHVSPLRRQVGREWASNGLWAEVALRWMRIV